MSLKSAVLVVTVFALAPFGACQAWKESYDQALTAAAKGDWAAAKAAFQAAIAVRPEDQSAPTVLPGPVTEPIKWRNGSPYSPNFGSAFSSYKIGLASKDQERAAALQEAQTGFETLIAKNQVSVPTLYFLNQVYGLQGKPDKQRELEPRMADAQSGAWKVDTGFVPPEELGTMNSAIPSNNYGGTRTTTTDGGPGVTIVHPGSDVTTTFSTSVAGRVPVLASKFALLVGNSQTQMNPEAVPFAATDAMEIQTALVQNAGYDEKNVDVMQNVTAGQMLTAAQALADRLPVPDPTVTSPVDSEPTVLIFFSGIGVNIDGKDYFAGIDAAMTTDTSKMVAKEDLLKVFRAKGAKVFLFCEANRPIKDGRYFGMETPLVGKVALCQATSPDGTVYGTMSGGKLIGIYAKAFVDVLAAFRSNQVPIGEFGWAVFQMIQGGSGVGGTQQVPSSPNIRYMSVTTPF